MRPIVYKIALCFLSIVLLVTGCSSSEDQQAKYMERAKEKYAAGEFKKSQLELRNVFQINPHNPEGRYLRSLMYIEEEEWRLAIKNLTVAIEYDPNFVDARVELAKIYLQFGPGRDEYTAEQVDAILAIDPDNLDALSVRAQMLVRQGERGLAFKDAQRVLAKKPSDIGAVRVMLRQKKQKREVRVALLDEAVAHAPMDSELRMFVIRVLAKMRKTEALVEGHYRTLIEQNPDEIGYYQGLADYLIRNKRFDETETLLREVIASKPENLELKLWLAQFLASVRSLDEAEETIESFVEQHPQEYKLRFALAEIYRATGKQVAAKKVYEDIIDLDVNGADSLLARNHLVQYYLSVEQDRQKADLLLADIFAIEETNTEALLVRARTKILDNKLQDAIIDLRTVVKNNPESERGLLMLAEAYSSLGSVELALDTYRTVLELPPRDKTAVLLYCQLLIDDKQFALADKVLEEASQDKDIQGDALGLQIKSYASRGQWQQALAATDTLATLPESTARAKRLRGQIELRMGNNAAAETTYRDLMNADPTVAQHLSGMAESILRTRGNKSAEQYLLEHLKTYPQDNHARDLLGRLYQREGNFELAKSQFEAALESEPNRDSSLMALAQVYQQTNDPQAALARYEKALSDKPENIPALVFKAGLHESMGDLQDASETYERVLEIAPENRVAANNLAMLLVDQIRTPQSIERALQVTQDFEASNIPTFIDTRGWVHYHQGDYPTAIRLLDRAVSLEETNDTFKYHLGLAYSKTGDRESAKKYLEAALASGQNFPDRENAQSVLETL